MDDLKWYQSTQGPQISLTLKAVSGLLIPVLMQLFQIQIGSDTVNSIIDAVLIIVFGVIAVVGHIRAKKTLGAQIQKLKG